MSAAATEAIRQVPVARLSPRDELANLVRLAATVILGVWLYLASSLSDDGTGRKRLLPFQALVQTQSTVEQRMFRELQEGLLEAEAIRGTTGAWPPPETLARDGIPPFASDPTAKAATYRWQLLRDGTYVNYLGTPDKPDAPRWLVWVHEPEPGTPPDQLFEDEEHHRLIDGTMLHVSTWKHAAVPPGAARVWRVPQAEGWTQLYAVGPGQKAPPR
jgi:hypothetical protein